MFVPITQFRAVVAPTCGCGTRQHAKTKKRRKAVALMIEHRKNAAASTIERFFIFQMRRRKAAALMIERLFVLRKEERKKAAALTIERIFIMEKAAVDLEIVRQQRQSSKNSYLIRLGKNLMRHRPNISVTMNLVARIEGKEQIG